MIKTIALYEFLFTIKRKSYYLVTFGMPVIALAYFGLIAVIVLASVPSELEKLSKPVGVIDYSGFLTAEGGALAGIEFGETTEIKTNDLEEISELGDLPIDASQFEFLSTQTVLHLKDMDSAKVALQDETIRQVTIIPMDYLKEGRFKVYVKKSELLGGAMGNGWLRDAISNQLLSTTELSKDEIARIQTSSSSTEYEIGDSGEFVEVDKLTKGFSLGMPLAIAGLLIMALMMNSGLLLASIAEEKENKVMEVIVSSVSADRLLLGKVLGIVLAGVLQIAVWMSMMAVVPVLSMTVLSESFEYNFNVLNLAIGTVFVLLGFVFYGCLLAGLGSLGSNYKDCQQLSVAVILCACVPFMLPTVFLSNPNGLIARILSMIPLFSPVAMMARLGIDDVPWWELALSLAILLFGIYAAIKISARLFRAGTLMQGKRPGIREIWKVLTQPA